VNQSWRIYRTMYIEDNKWRAVRYGIDGNLIDFGIESEVPMRFLARELLEIVDDVVDDLGSRQDVEYVKTIIDRGTSADRQLKIYRAALQDGKSEREALCDVVDYLIEETSEGWRRDEPVG
jgi:carboxylate-amine ligase